MKDVKKEVWIISLCVLLAILGFANHRSAKKNYEKSLNELITKEQTTVSMEFGYYQNDEGLWVYQGKTYKEKLDIKGSVGKHEIEYTVLTNKEGITFENIYSAYGMGGLHSNDERELLGLERKYSKSELVVVDEKVK